MAACMQVELVWLVPVVFAAAVLYTSVGHGGASIYLAILTLAGYAVSTLVPAILVLNIAAAAIAFIAFGQAGHLRRNLLAPFLVGGVPFAFVGALVQLQPGVQDLLLGVALAAAAVRFLFVARPPARTQAPAGRRLWLVALPLGGSLGFLAGVVGIGGGIFLSPALVMLGWADVRESASIASAFIVVNSAAGLAGRAASMPIDWGFVVTLLLPVVLGAMLGAGVAARHAREALLRIMLAFVLAAAAARALWL